MNHSVKLRKGRTSSSESPTGVTGQPALGASEDRGPSPSEVHCGSFDAGGRPMLDLVIRGGTLVDGSGAAGRPADVGIRAGRVVALGRVEEAARETLDATGRAVAPGFVDIHTH